MGDKSGLCLWCGRWTELKAPDGLADCDRPDCIEKRVYEDEFDDAGRRTQTFGLAAQASGFRTILSHEDADRRSQVEKDRAARLVTRVMGASN